MDFEIQNRNLMKLSNAIAHELRQMILQKGFEPGQRFYTEREVMEKWSCSRATAREAVLLLEFEGLVVSKPGPSGGTFVREPDTSSILRPFHTFIDFKNVEHSEVIEARIELETRCAFLAAIRSTHDDLVKIEQALLRFEEKALSQKQFEDENANFHLAIADAAHNRVLLLLMQVLESIIVEDTKKFEYTKEQLDQVIFVHRRIYDAIVSKDFDASARRMRRHLKEFAEFGPMK